MSALPRRQRSTVSRRLRCGLVACTLAAALAAAAAPARSADHGAGARLDVTADLVSGVVGFGTCGVLIHATGTATGTHVGGKGTWVDDECVDFTGHLTGHGTLTSTNGDAIFFAYELTTPPPDPAIHARGTYTIVGGTGHFAGATGSGTLAVDGVPGSLEVAQFDGTVSLGLGG
jgi:hypothetical protein